VYPRVLYDRVFALHKGGLERAVDLGAGSGQATQAIAERITDTVIATDPSSAMLEQGKAKLGTSGASGCKIEWKVTSAESMPFLSNQSVDLVVSGISHLSDTLPRWTESLGLGQAAHWFNHEAVWKELRRIVRPKGTVAYWVCGALVASYVPCSLTIDMAQGYGDMARHRYLLLYMCILNAYSRFCHNIHLLGQ
jgi:SAM-dependent methyltransferase